LALALVPIRHHVLATIVLTLGANACEPQLKVGNWSCPASDAGRSSTVEVPWSTGFENDLCDYLRSGGGCIVKPDASARIVNSPTHSGNGAVAYSVTSDASKNGTTARCYVQGAMPTSATYGAWFYMPKVAINVANWNLVHFEGGQPEASHGLWDVTVANSATGGLVLFVYDLVRGPRTPKALVPIPIGKWFHIEFRLKRSKSATGEMALYQDGVLIDEATGLVTDDTDYGRWFVGNLATGLTPPDYTLYVDDVTITATP
jgi:hypothetical protein